MFGGSIIASTSVPVAANAGKGTLDKMHEAGHHTTFGGLYVVQPEFSSPTDSIYKRGLCL